MSVDRPSDRPVTQPGDPVESRPVASRQRNIRVEDALWDAASAEAARQGMKVAEFVREAIAFRLGYLAHLEHGAALSEVEALLRRVAEKGEA